MTATAHAVIGTVIAAKISNPYAAIPLAVASHIVADMIPHWDVGTNARKKTKKRLVLESVADVLISFALSYWLINRFFPITDLYYAFIMVIAAQGLDWLMSPYYFLGIKQFKWAYNIGKATNTEIDKPWGIIYQVAFLVLVLVVGLIV